VKTDAARLIEAARLRVELLWPYLSAAQRALRGPIVVPDLIGRAGGPMAVDSGWRLYADPEAVSRWTVAQIATVLRHETWHCLRDHSGRRGSRDPRRWNVAADFEVDSDIVREQPAPEWPPGPHPFPEDMGFDLGLLAEEYYEKLEAQGQSQGGNQSAAGDDVPGAGSPEGGAPAPGEAGQDPSTGTELGDGDSEDGTGAGEGTSPPGQHGPSDPSRGSDAGGDGAAAGGEGGDQSGGDGAGVSPGSPSGSAPSPSGSQTPSTSSAGGAGGVGGQVGTAASGSPSGPGPSPGGSGGSNQDGIARSWELTQDGRDRETGEPRGPAAVSDVEGEITRRAVAEAIRIAVASHARGTMPAGMTRWADELLRPPVIDWRQVLRRAIQDGLSAPGQADYTYARPSRRDPGCRRGYVAPSLHSPRPEVAVIVDTSGSVSDTALGEAAAEVVGVARAVGGQVWTASVDAAVYQWRQVRAAHDLVLEGGGGTDMCAGIKAAARRRPKPQVVVVLTDGLTPWPDDPTRGTRLVAVLVGTGHAARETVPPWATVVEVA
jgi:predicted metal-dependent peptidase